MATLSLSLSLSLRINPIGFGLKKGELFLSILHLGSQHISLFLSFLCDLLRALHKSALCVFVADLDLSRSSPFAFAAKERLKKTRALFFLSFLGV